MHHADIKTDLDAFLDGELDPARAAQVKIHLSECAACRKQVQEWELVRSAFFKPAAVKAPADFTVRVMEAIEARRPADLRSILRWLVPSSSIALAALFVVSIIPLAPEDAANFEPLMIKGAGPLVAHEFTALQKEAERDWMGLEVL